MEVDGKRTDTDGGSVIKPEHVCEPCQGDNVTTQASGFCKDCGEFMCDTCFKHHLRGKLCRHHVLMDLDLSSLPSAGDEEDVLKCNKHNGEKVRFYCRKHEVVGCGDCMILEHNACNSEYIKNVSENFQQNERFKTLIGKIQELTSESKSLDNKLRKDEKDNKLMLEKALGDIRKFRADINEYLDAVESDVISKAKQIMSDNDKLLTKLTQDCKGLSSKIEKVKEMLNTELYEDNVLFINSVDLKSRVTELEQEITLAHSKHMRGFEFVCDPHLRDFVTSKQFGSIAITTTVPHHQTTQMTTGRDETTFKTASKNEKSFDRKEKVEHPEKKTLIGARVRHNWRFQEMTGTVTAVHPDGTVNVQWDSGWRNVGPFTVGTGFDQDVKVV